MKLLGIQSKEVYGLFEISSKDLKLLLDALDLCQLNIDEKDIAHVKARDYFVDVFTKQMIEFEEALKRDYGA